MIRFSLLALTLFLTQLSAAELPVGFVELRIWDHLNPVAMTLDHHGNLWLAEKHGQVRILSHDGVVQADPFIQLPVDDFNERGLLGIALHPDFDHQPYVYLYYTVVGANHNRISRFLANGNLAVPGSEEILLDLDPLSGYVHNGGAMLFGPDGKLYVATGEGANPPSSQDLNSLHGKILRLEPDGSIPPDNPFIGQLNGKYASIWTLGHRNPFSMAFSPDGTKLWTTDVGQGDYEEINRMYAGANYGWPQIEGPITTQIAPPNYEDPWYAYDHDLGCAIVGADFCPASPVGFPETYQGDFFFADYCEGYIKHLDLITGEVATFAEGVSRPLAICFDPEHGKMYYLTRAGIGGGSPEDNTATQAGELWMVTYTGSGAARFSLSPQSILVPLGESAHFEARANGVAPLWYEWFQGEQLIGSGSEPQLLLPAPTLADSGELIRCVVSNAEGRDTSDAAVLRVTKNQRPQPSILFPADGSSFQAGDTIFFAGRAEDPETGSMADSLLQWEVVWHHNDHTHPGPGPFIGTDSGYWVVPTVNETDTNVWYRLHLQASDLAGLAQRSSVDLRPTLAPILIQGPVGASINLDGRIRHLPHIAWSMVGLQRIIEVPLVSEQADQIYRFRSWGDGTQDHFWIGAAPEEGLQLEVLFDTFTLGQGIGLMGTYFQDSTLEFASEPVFQRIDTSLSFLWGNDSPDAEHLNKDYFMVRWEGDIQAVFGENYTFQTRTDDGVRLWVGEELLIDQWQPQATTIYQASKPLQAGKRYPIRLEYFEKDGGAEMVLKWSSLSTPLSPIPKRQLYPEHEVFPGEVVGQVWEDLNLNQFRDLQEAPLRGMAIHLRSALDSSLFAATFSDSLGHYGWEAVPPGTYFLQFFVQSTGKWLQAGRNLDVLGRTPAFDLPAQGSFQFSAGFGPLDQRWEQPFPLLQIFPQPMQDQLTISFVQRQSRQVSLHLFDMQGRLCLANTVESQVGVNVFELSVGSIPAGLYLLQIAHQEGRFLQKVVKQ